MRNRLKNSPECICNAQDRHSALVMPAKAGIQVYAYCVASRYEVDSRFRGNDVGKRVDA